jgi:hypothetical protein
MVMSDYIMVSNILYNGDIFILIIMVMSNISTNIYNGDYIMMSNINRLLISIIYK